MAPQDERFRATRWGVLAATATGVLAILAYPPFGAWPLAFVAYAPLYAWLELARPSAKAAAWSGLWAGTLLHAAVYSFLAFTMREMSGLPDAAAAAVLLIYSVAMGLHQALWAWLVRVTAPERLDRPGPVLARLGLVAAAYASVEFAVPYLFPWFLGNAFYATPLWIQAADLVGIAGISLLAVLSAGLLTWTVARPALRLQLGAVLALLLAAWAGYGALRLQQVDTAPVRQVLRVTMVQGNASLEEKKANEPLVRRPMLDRAERLTTALDAAGTDLVVWPEGALPFFYVPDAVGPGAAAEKGLPSRAPPVLKETKARVHALVARMGKPLLFGALRRPDRMWHEELRNSAILLWPDGREQAYDKRILLPFGEYLPGTAWLPALKEAIPGVSHMEPGTVSGLAEVGGVRLLVNICYEALFGGFLRAEGATADVLVNLTNDIWFGPDAAPELHLMVQQARPVELRRPLLRSTVTGITAYVDAAGRIGERTDLFTEATRHVEVPVRDLGSPYRWWGDAPMWALTGLTAVAAAWALRRRRRTGE